MKENEEAYMEKINIESDAQKKLISARENLDISLTESTIRYRGIATVKIATLLHERKEGLVFLTTDYKTSKSWFLKNVKDVLDPDYPMNVTLEKVVFTAHVPVADLGPIIISRFLVTARDEVIGFAEKDPTIFKDYPCAWDHRFYKDFLHEPYLEDKKINGMYISSGIRSKEPCISPFFSSAIFIRR